MTVRPRQLAHRGTVDAAALYFATPLVGEERLRARVLSLWQRGTTLFRLARGCMVVLPCRLRVSCDNALGAPLVLDGGCYWAAPFDDDERAALLAEAGDVVLVGAGEAIVERPSEEIDPSDWLPLDGFVLKPTRALVKPAPPALVVEPVAVVDRDRLVPGLGAPPPEQSAILAALVGARRGEASVGTAGGGGWWSGLVGWLRGLRSPALAGTTALVPRQQSPLWTAIRNWFARGAFWLRLGRLLGARQARYLAEMMEMLQGGDVREGLRRAIPLSDGPSAEGPPALGLPSRRDQLDLTLGGGTASSTMYLVGDLFSDLRTVYRQLFQRLKREKRVDEAVFVLAELLRADAEAVAYLEEVGRLRLAAELAEARNLPPGLVVRQWFIARDIGRVLSVAERHDAFADAIVRLEKTHAEEARALRLLWADRLASRGDYAQAVDVVWRIDSARGLVAKWAEHALELGGTVAARMAVRWLRIAPAELERVAPRVVELLSDASIERLDERLALLNELARDPSEACLAPLARLGLRAQLRDAAKFGDSAQQSGVRKGLLRQAADGSLRADLPSLPRGRSSARWDYSIAANDRGTLAIHDVARLPSGDFLLALGELGIKWVRCNGRTVTRFDVPAHRIVLSDHGDRALALAVRGETARVARIDVLRRRAEPWTDLTLIGCARDFDGATWFVAEPDGVAALDVEGDRPLARWRVDRLGGPAIRLARDARTMRFVVFSASGFEAWTYQLPSLTLRARRACDGVPIGLALGSETIATTASVDIVLSDGTSTSVLSTDGHEPAGLSFDESWRVASIVGANGKDFFAYRGNERTPSRTASLVGAETSTYRVANGVLTAADDRGRLIAIHLETGGLIANLRINA
jgi:hypothetical protein